MCARIRNISNLSKHINPFQYNIFQFCIQVCATNCLETTAKICELSYELECHATSVEDLSCGRAPAEIFTFRNQPHTVLPKTSKGLKKPGEIYDFEEKETKSIRSLYGEQGFSGGLDLRRFSLSMQMLAMRLDLHGTMGLHAIREGFRQKS